MENKIVFYLLLIGTLFCACQEEKATGTDTLPILGFPTIENGDTIHHKIPAFRFVNQDSQFVTNATFSDDIYIADFFFTACPTICPKVKKQMLRLYERYKDEPNVVLLSHTVDVKRDTVGRLKQYASNLDVVTERWQFVTGDHDEIYAIADDYFSIARVDPNAPGGFDHSGRLILVDREGHVRAFCDGTSATDVDALMLDVDKLLKEEV
ncbi:MAG: SCO family protein [Bacteroidota bacterium]